MKLKNLVVSKFGGSSVKDAIAMQRCAKIIENNPLIKIVVVSATQNTTNQLELIAHAAEAGDENSLNNLTEELINRHQKIATELFISSAKLEDLCESLRKNVKNILQTRHCSPKIMDELYSFGELMSSLLMFELLQINMPKKDINLLDVRDIIKTNSEFKMAKPQVDLILKNAKNHIYPHLNNNTLFITQGFIGADHFGNTTTLGREGSDYSATLLGEAINASLVEIWTDVPGVASSDPFFVKKAKFIQKLSYDEATALATLGATILFPSTLQPTKRKKIPVFIGSSINPENKGTLITEEQNSDFSLKAVSHLINPEANIVSFIGTNINKKENLVKILHGHLGETAFEFSDLTNVSISFKSKSPSMDKATSLNFAHEVLEKFL